MWGGAFLDPADTISPQGKLRLLYEAAPLAFVVEQAGGAATDGARDILDIKPTELHQRTPPINGAKRDGAHPRAGLGEKRTPIGWGLPTPAPGGRGGGPFRRAR